MNTILCIVALFSLAYSQVPPVANPGFPGTLYAARPCYFVAHQTKLFGHASFVHKTDTVDQCIDACEAKKEICKSVMFLPTGSCIFNCILIPVNSLDVPTAVSADTVTNADLYNRVSTCNLPAAVAPVTGLVPAPIGTAGQVAGQAAGTVGQVAGTAGQVAGTAGQVAGQTAGAATGAVGGATNLVWNTVPDRPCFKSVAQFVLSQNVPREVKAAADVNACLDLCANSPTPCKAVEWLPGAAGANCVTHADSVTANQNAVAPAQQGVQSTLFEKTDGCVPSVGGISPLGVLPVGIPPVSVPPVIPGVLGK